MRDVLQGFRRGAPSGTGGQQGLLIRLFLLCLIGTPFWAAAGNVSSRLPGPGQVPDGGFESPVVTSQSGYIYRPSGSSWSFSGGSGYSKNGTAFTNANPNAPEGQQILFLQGTGKVNQSLDLAQGFYQVRFYGAQRGNHNNGGQTFVLRIDGAVAGTITPPGSGYKNYRVDLGYLAGGSHSIELQGTNPLGGDNTAFVDDVKIERVKSIPVDGGDMETPYITDVRGYEYAPSGGPISFISGAGLTQGGTGFTIANPNPPQGAQVLFLQRTGQASLTVNIPATAVYRFHYKVALRGNNQPEEQSLRVTIDSEEIDEFEVIGTDFNPYHSLCIELTAGNHTLTLAGINPAGGDNTAFVDDIQLELVPAWTDPYTWNEVTVPTTGDNITINRGTAVALTGTHNMHHIVSNGELLAVQNEDLNVSARYILIQGEGAKLELGKELTPYNGNAVFTLKATATDPEIMFMGNKFIAAMDTAQVELHGLAKLSWTQLGVTANAGASSITLKEGVNWEVGDSIVIASTDYNPHYAEVRKITAISLNKKVISFADPLNYMHYGVKEIYNSPYRTHELDMRAEVGNLTRNILIQGNAASEDDGFGAHTMFMVTSTVHFSNVELFRCGQKSILARYPFHWHFAGAVKGQYIKNCAIHHSFNRIVTVHGTDSALVEGNVGYDHIGHGYFLENGSEMGNYFINNLGVLTKAPLPGEEVELHDLVVENGMKKLPATFWITNPGNHWIGNVAAGAEGSGFWQVNLNAALQGSTLQDPKNIPLGTFADNRAHSNDFSNYAIDGSVDATTGAFIGGHYRPEYSPGNPAIPVIERFTAYRCRIRNIWMRANTMRFEDCSATDGRNITLFAYNQIYHNSLLVGVSGNTGNPMTQHEINAGRSLGNPNASYLAGGNRVVGYNVYDGPAEYRKVHFAGFTGGNVYCISPVGAAQKSTVHMTDSLTFDSNIDEEDKVMMLYSTHMDHIYSSGVIDEDGSLTDIPGARVTPGIKPESGAPVYRIYEDGFNHEPGATYRADWNAWICPNEHYGLLRLDHQHPESMGSNIYAIRSDGPATFNKSPGGIRNQNPVMVNAGFQYHWQYHRMPYQTEAWMRFVDNGDEVVSVFPNLPSTTRVLQSNNQPLAEASSLSDLLNTNSQQYYFRDNTLYLKHVGANGGSDPQFGDLYSAISPKIRLCQEANCSNAASKTDYMTLADFEMGDDSRVLINGTLPVSQEIYDSNADPFDATDNRVRWTINTDGDGAEEYVQLKLSMDRQIWTEFENLRLNFTGAKLQIYVHDADDGYKNLGTYDPGSDVVVPLGSQDPNDYVYFDNIDWILLRTKESFLGSLNSNLSATISLYSILLDDGTASKSAGSPQADLNSFQDGNWSLWPNPTSGGFQLEGYLDQGGLLSIAIYDMQGRSVFNQEQSVTSGTWSREFRAEETDLSKGIYQVVIREGAKAPQSLKLVIR